MDKSNVFSDHYSKYYNLFYADKQYAEEAAYIDNLIRQYSNGGTRVLEYGSGTGGHGVLFQKLGYRVTGIEKSQQMAAVAMERGLPCVVSDIADFTIDGKHDVCLALFHVISYVNDNTKLLKVFENTRKHLEDTGIFIFDVWFTPAVMHDLPEVRVKRLETPDVRVTRVAEPAIDYSRNVVDVNYHVVLQDKITGVYNEFSEAHPMRHFGIPEIELIAMQTGFTILAVEEFLSGQKPSVNTWGVTFVLSVK